MTQTSRIVDADPSDVFAQLADGWIYGAWVVGASHIRGVDENWPQVGSRLHHRVGPWPLAITDTTEVLEMVPDKRLVLKARAWPAGEARVEIDIAPDRAGAVVTMGEAPTKGIFALLDNPLVRLVLRKRNEESLARLADLSSRRPDPNASRSA
jgi:hypothetical protein